MTAAIRAIMHSPRSARQSGYLHGGWQHCLLAVQSQRLWQKSFADKELTKEITLEETVIKAAHKAQKVEAKAPTATEEGNIEYWYCEAFAANAFADEALTKEIAKKKTPS